MYEELVHSLRICGDSADPIAECGYEDCIQHEHPIDTQCMRALCHKAADAIEELLAAAKKMHTWIFLNTGDEQAAYDECGLSDEMNAALGYAGQFVVKEDE